MAEHILVLDDEAEKDLAHCCAEFHQDDTGVLMMFVAPALQSHRAQRIADEAIAFKAAFDAAPDSPVKTAILAAVEVAKAEAVSARKAEPPTEASARPVIVEDIKG